MGSEKLFFLLVVVVGVLISCCNTQISEDELPPVEFDDVAHEKYYDYIVVGVGASGSVSAARLAEAGYQVLGIDGGARSHRSLGGTDFVAAKFIYNKRGKLTYDRTPWTRFDVPIFYPSIYTQPTPWETYEAILNGSPIQPIEMPGKYLGGAGVHNGLQWARWTKPNFDSWKVRGWYYDDVLPYYKKSENYTGTYNQFNTRYHGLNGPIKITDSPIGQKYYESTIPLIQACINAGLPNNTDLNGASREGCAAPQFNTRRGIRDSSANAYLPSALRGGNLHLSLESFATRIIFKQENGRSRAVGVEYEQWGEKKVVYARKEIIISLNAVLTPKLLLLSGIGSAATLKKFNIPLVVNNTNVGKNLCNNHLTTGAAWSYPGLNQPNGFRVSEDANLFAFNGTGAWSTPALFTVFYACSKQRPCVDPDVYIGTTGGAFLSSNSVGRSLQAFIETATPKGVGTITLGGADPYAPPVIDFPVTGNQADVDSLSYGLKLMRRIMKTFPANITFGEEVSPGPSVSTDAQIAAWVRRSTIFAAHWFGSARLGYPSDPTAVVDPQLRVLGVSGLRVGDTSVFVNGGAHTHASAIMVGERVAAFVLDDA